MATYGQSLSWRTKAGLPRGVSVDGYESPDAALWQAVRVAISHRPETRYVWKALTQDQIDSVLRIAGQKISNLCTRDVVGNGQSR
jgi:K+-transporting ATPase c subunit